MERQAVKPVFDKAKWKPVTLADVADEIASRIENPSESGYTRFVGLEHFVSGELVIRNWGTTENLASAMKVCHAGDVLIARRNVYLRRASMVDFDGLCSGDAIVLREKQDIIVPRFLPFILNTDRFWEYANANADGSMSKRINVKTLMKYTFLLPPLEEQRRLAELLWAADETIQKYNATLHAIQTIQNCYEQEMTDILTSGKNEHCLSDFVQFASGQVDPQKEPYSSMPLVASNHIESGTGKIIKVESAADQNAISGKYLFYRGQVVYSKIRPTLRKAIIAPFDGLCSADMYPLTTNEKQLRPDFLLRILLGKYFTDYASSHSVRTSIPKLNRKEMGAFRLTLPSIEYQNTFMEKYNTLETYKNNFLEQMQRVMQMQRLILNGGGMDV